MAIGMLSAIETMVWTAKSAAGFLVDFCGEEGMQKIEILLGRQGLVVGKEAGESLRVVVTPAGRVE